MSANDSNCGGGPEILRDSSPIVSASAVNVAASLTGAKMSNIKASTGDSVGSGGTNLTSSNAPLSVAAVSNGSTSTILTNTGVNTGVVKVTCGNIMSTSIGTPITLPTTQAHTATAIRTINTGGQSTQVRVVMQTGVMPSSMIKQLENTASSRTQITAVPTQNPRTISSTSITVTRPATQTYLPRTGVAPSQLAGMVTAAQRLVTPVRSATGASVASLTTTGNLVRATPFTRNCPSPATTVISAATNTTWMATNTTGQVQLIRAISHQPRQRIVTTQGLSGAVGVTAVVASSTATLTTTSTAPSSTVHAQIQQTQPITSQSAPHNQQYASGVLPARQHQATLVYSSNMSSQPQSGQQILSSATPAQRFTVATSLPSAVGSAGGPRHLRPISLSKPFPTAKLNATSISIRTPNMPQLTPTSITSVPSVSVTSAGAQRSASICSVTGTTGGSILPATNLSTARIIQLQQQQGGGGQQIIGSTARLPSNVMLQPIIVNTSAAGKLSFRPPVTMATKVQSSLTITQVGIGKMPTSVCTSVGQQLQTLGETEATSTGGVAGVTSLPVHTSNTAASATLASVSTAQLSSTTPAAVGAQLLTAQNIVSSAGGTTVLPLAINTRGTATGNILTGTIMPLKNANGVAVGKLMTQAHVGLAESSSTTSGASGSLSIRFNTQGPCTDNDPNTVATSSAHILQDNSSQQILIPSLASTHPASGPSNQQGNMLIPLPTSIKLSTSVAASGGGSAGASAASTSSTASIASIIRQREANGSPVRCAKNLGPTLLSMSSNMLNPSGVSTFNVASVGTPIQSAFTTEVLTAKHHGSRPGTPDFSDGSTTVSANSSPGVEQQMQDHNLVMSSMESGNAASGGTSHFNPINEMYLSHHVINPQSAYQSPSTSSRAQSLEGHPKSSGGSASVSATSGMVHLEEAAGSGDVVPRKKSRRSTNDSQLSTQSQTAHILPPPSISGACNTIVYPATVTSDETPIMVDTVGPVDMVETEVAEESEENKTNPAADATPTTSNKENAKPVEYRLRRRRNCTLLNTYKQTWKSAHNHFQRYSDVKPREERRPSIIDLANQTNILSKINGWKVYHLRAQMEELYKHEMSSYDHLCKVLMQMEACDKSPDNERVTDLLKGNIQRSKIVIDGVSEAKNQMMKIFDHKSHVCDIINRCASKRNFKKRDKN